MTATRNLLAFDLGAESGRGVLGRFDGQRLALQDVHRFPNSPAATLDTMHWDVLSLYNEMLTGMRKCAGQFGGVDSVGVDTWGVDFALLGRGGTLLGNPRHYRDPHTEGAMDLAFHTVPPADLYARTGIQFMRFNSLFQLLALQRDRSPLLDVAETLLFIPDLFHYFFNRDQGERIHEHQHQPDAEPEHARLGPRVDPHVPTSDEDSRHDHFAGHCPRPAPHRHRPRHGPVAGAGDCAGHARHRGGGRGVCLPAARTGRSLAAAPGR